MLAQVYLRQELLDRQLLRSPLKVMELNEKLMLDEAIAKGEEKDEREGEKDELSACLVHYYCPLHRLLLELKLKLRVKIFRLILCNQMLDYLTC